MFARLLTCTMLLFAQSFAASAAVPISFIETWEDDVANVPVSSPWYVDPHMADGGLMVIGGAIYNNTYLGNNGLLLNYAGFNGKNAGIQAKLVLDGQEIKATDLNKLILEYSAKGDDSQMSEWYIELSMGDVHAPRLADVGDRNPLPAPIPVIAYCKPLFDPAVKHKSTWCFDGIQWLPHGAMDWDDNWTRPILQVATSTIRVECTCQNNPATIPRAYVGNFDRVSIYTLDGVYSTYTVIDDLKIKGGDVVHTLSVSPSATFVSTGPQGGSFLPACQTYTLSNISATPIDWSADSASDWLTISPNSGTLAGGATLDVSVCINTNANALPLSMYPGVVNFNDITHSISQARNIELYVGQIDSFTEQFSGNNDLDHRSIMLTPEGAPHYYHACSVIANQFPTPPTGGIDLALNGDNSVKVTLQQGAQVAFYGTLYSEFYVGSNGYITFGEGDTLATGTAADHFKKRRISGLFTDLIPQAGQVSYKQLMDRVAVTYQNVVKAGTAEANSFQIELFYDGRLRLSWLDIATTVGVAGLSKGLGLPTNFHSSDLSAYAACSSAGYPADFDEDDDVDLSDFGHLQVCLAGQPGLILNPPCANTDLDLDGVVGQGDVWAFFMCLSGPNVTPPANCVGF